MLPGSLISIYQGVEEQNLDQNHLVLQVGGLMQRASSSLITQKQDMLKNQTPSLGRNGVWFPEDGDSC